MYTYFTKEVNDLNADTTHWEAIRSHKMANGDTHYFTLKYCDTKEHALAALPEKESPSRKVIRD